MTSEYETVTQAGSKAPWIVMVHGMSQNRRVFSAQVDAFATDYRILLVDLPGHGLAAEVPGPYGHLEMAAHVANVIDDAAIGPCHYWATHTGTAVGLLLAAERPARFLSMILEGAVVPGRSMPYVEAMIGRVRRTVRSAGVEAAREQWFAEGGWFDVIRQNPEECRAQAHRKIVDDFACVPWLDDSVPAPVEPIDSRLPRTNMPVLLYNGEHDLEDFLDVAEILHARLPNANKARIPGGGGFPAWEFPELVNRLVRAFLAEVATRGPHA